MSDTYTGLLSYPDANTAAKLCHDGPCSYRIKAGSAVTDSWILENVVPNIAASSYGHRVALVLGKALLWVCFSHSESEWVHGPIRTRILNAYKALVGEDESPNNPIEKCLLVISGMEAQIMIQEIGPSDRHENRGGSNAQQQQEGDVSGGFAAFAAGYETQSSHQLMLAILHGQSQMRQEFRQELGNIRQEFFQDFRNLEGQLRRVNENVHRVGIQPARMMQHAATQRENAAGGHATARPAELCPKPTD